MRRFIVCFDGTWNAPDKGANPTNVVKLVRAVANTAGGISQVTFYDKGVGTGDALDRIAGGASGKGLTENMVDGYRFLANNYADGDEIYIFGFSRGAYTARSLAGFIGLAGLFSPPELGSGLTKAIDVYRNTELTREQRPEKIRELGLDRKEDVPIRCVGVWDTVGSLGIPGDLGRRLLGAKLDFHDVQLNARVEIALHAVAVDEKRSAFAPTLWVRPKDAPAPAAQVVEQVWFPGVHSNVGGSYADAGLSDVALDWMIKRVQQLTGLSFEPEYLAEYVKPNAFAKGVESRAALYKDSVPYPYQRLINQTVPRGEGFGECSEPGSRRSTGATSRPKACRPSTRCSTCHASSGGPSQWCTTVRRTRTVNRRIIDPPTWRRSFARGRRAARYRWWAGMERFLPMARLLGLRHRVGKR